MASSLFTLDISGTLLALAFGIAVLYFGLGLWWFFIAVLVDFLVLSSLATKAGDGVKSGIRGYEKVRSWKNVAANGVVPVMVIIAYFLNAAYQFAPSYIFVAAFVASVAAITADKFASEFGVLDGTPTTLITGKKARKGTSGAITWFGTLMGIVASFFVGFTYFAIGQSLFVFAVIIVAGVAGNLVDSFFGYFEENGIGNKYTSNILCSAAGALVCLAVLYAV